MLIFWYVFFSLPKHIEAGEISIWKGLQKVSSITGCDLRYAILHSLDRIMVHIRGEKCSKSLGRQVEVVKEERVRQCGLHSRRVRKRLPEEKRLGIGFYRFTTFKGDFSFFAYQGLHDLNHFKRIWISEAFTAESLSYSCRIHATFGLPLSTSRNRRLVSVWLYGYVDIPSIATSTSMASSNFQIVSLNLFTSVIPPHIKWAQNSRA